MNGSSRAQHGTIQSMYKACSYNTVSFNESYNVVLGPVSVPCTGSLQRGNLTVNWDASKRCGAAEQAAWLEAAEAYAVKVRVVRQYGSMTWYETLYSHSLLWHVTTAARIMR